MKHVIIAGILLGAVAGLLAEQRSWTNEKGQVIRAELVDVREGNAVLKMGGREYEVAIGTLSAADGAYIEQWESERATAEVAQTAAAERATAAADEELPELIETLNKSLVRLDGRRVKRFKFEDPGKIEIVAFYSSASWCGPCQRFSPTLVDEYEKLKRRYDNFEVVLLTSDHTEDAFEQYIEDHDMPFPAVAFDKKNLNGRLASGKKSNGIPNIMIKTADGEVLDDASRGANRSLQHLKEILKERGRKS